MSNDREDEFCKAFSGLLVTSSSIQLLLKVFPCDEELKKSSGAYPEGIQIA